MHITVDPGFGLTPVTVEAKDEKEAVDKAIAHYQETLPDHPVVKIMTAVAQQRADVGGRPLTDDEVRTITRACFKETSAGVQPAQVKGTPGVEGDK